MIHFMEDEYRTQIDCARALAAKKSDPLDLLRAVIATYPPGTDCRGHVVLTLRLAFDCDLVFASMVQNWVGLIDGTWPDHEIRTLVAALIAGERWDWSVAARVAAT